eukprot:GHVP01058643.1.p1 GENE.GHVP01058643.1~~GHVP01058643.1.p1  ORF type:complete len:377 (+),score=72.49 GHVP01058643.1:505-1635(+)
MESHFDPDGQEKLYSFETDKGIITFLLDLSKAGCHKIIHDERVDISSDLDLEDQTINSSYAGSVCEWRFEVLVGPPNRGCYSFSWSKIQPPYFELSIFFSDMLGNPIPVMESSFSVSSCKVGRTKNLFVENSFFEGKEIWIFKFEVDNLKKGPAGVGVFLDGKELDSSPFLVGSIGVTPYDASESETKKYSDPLSYDEMLVPVEKPTILALENRNRQPGHVVNGAQLFRSEDFQQLGLFFSKDLKEYSRRVEKIRNENKELSQGIFNIQQEIKDLDFDCRTNKVRTFPFQLEIEDEVVAFEQLKHRRKWLKERSLKVDEKGIDLKLRLEKYGEARQGLLNDLSDKVTERVDFANTMISTLNSLYSEISKDVGKQKF